MLCCDSPLAKDVCHSVNAFSVFFLFGEIWRADEGTGCRSPVGLNGNVAVLLVTVSGLSQGQLRKGAGGREP